MSDAETEDYGTSPAIDAYPKAGTSDAAAAATGNGMDPAAKEGVKLTSGAAMHDPYEFSGTEVQQDAVPDASRPAPAAAPHQVGHWGFILVGWCCLLATRLGHSGSSAPLARGGLCLVLIQRSAAS